MATVRTTFTTDDKDVQSALQRMVADTAKLREENRKLKEEMKSAGRESKKSTEDTNAGNNESLGLLGKVKVGWLAVAAAALETTKAYGQWRAEMDKIGQESTKFHQNLMADLAKTGDLAQSAQIKNFLGNLGATRDQATAAFAGVSEAMPAVGLERREQITAAVAKAAPMLQDPGALGGFAKQTGTIADLMPGLTPTQAASMTHTLRSQMGARSEQIGSDAFKRAVEGFQATGLSAEESLTFIAEASSKGIEVGNLAGLANKLTGEIDPVKAKRGEKLSAVQEGQNKAAQVQGADRLRLMLQDPDVRRFLGGDSAEAIGKIDPKRLFDIQGKLGLAQNVDMLQFDVDAARRDNPELFRGQDIAVGREATERSMEAELMAQENDRRAMDAQKVGQNLFGRMMTDAKFKGGVMMADVQQGLGMFDPQGRGDGDQARRDFMANVVGVPQGNEVSGGSVVQALGKTNELLGQQLEIQRRRDNAANASAPTASAGSN